MIDFDFIPARYHEKRALRRAVRVRTACLFGMFAIMGLWGVVHHYRMASVEAMLNEVMQQESQAQINRLKKINMEAELATLHDRGHLIDQLADQADLLVVLSDLSRRLPTSIVLTKVTLRCSPLDPYVEERAPVEQPAKASRWDKRLQRDIKAKPNPDALIEHLHRVEMSTRLKLSGIAASLPDIIQLQASLESSPLYDEVSMEVKDPTVWAGHRAESFALVCKLAAQERSRI